MRPAYVTRHVTVPGRRRAGGACVSWTPTPSCVDTNTTISSHLISSLLLTSPRARVGQRACFPRISGNDGCPRIWSARGRRHWRAGRVRHRALRRAHLGPPGLLGGHRARPRHRQPRPGQERRLRLRHTLLLVCSWVWALPATDARPDAAARVWARAQTEVEAGLVHWRPRDPPASVRVDTVGSYAHGHGRPSAGRRQRSRSRARTGPVPVAFRLALALLRATPENAHPHEHDSARRPGAC